MAGAESVDVTSWSTDLEIALLEGCDFGVIRNICKGQALPDRLRPKAWQVFLNVHEEGAALSNFRGLFDLPEQALIRKECRGIVAALDDCQASDRLGNAEEDKLALVSDLEEIITHYCKTYKLTYAEANGWSDVLQLLAAVKLQKNEIYNCFEAIMNRYIPRGCTKNGRPFHLFRLLLQYHDPELCNFLDTKKITPDLYALKWFQCLFCSVCDLRVCRRMWDVYFQQADAFLSFFLGLVLLLNAKEQIVELKSETSEKLIETISALPSSLDADDIEDFCGLAQYYASKTPQSFRRHYQSPLFGSLLATEALLTSSNGQAAEAAGELHALCLPVAAEELLHANQLGAGEGVRYFVVDCRPAEQYNAGHLPTAFHLDSVLMLHNPAEFAVAIQALTAAQKQALATGSAAAGEHLCFQGSGREEEDQYVHMVIAHFLQKKTSMVSFARGGYRALHEALAQDLSLGLVGHQIRQCIVCNPAAGSDAPDGSDSITSKLKTGALMNKITSLSSVVKQKSAIVKDKLTAYIKNEPHEERHISAADRASKGYRNMPSLFSIGIDDDEKDGFGDKHEAGAHNGNTGVGAATFAVGSTVDLNTLQAHPDVKTVFECQQIKDNEDLVKSHLVVTTHHLCILRDNLMRLGSTKVINNHPLKQVVKITSRKKMPELITFKLGTTDEDGVVHVTDVERFLIPKAGDAVKAVKMQVVQLYTTDLTDGKDAEKQPQAASQEKQQHT